MTRLQEVISRFLDRAQAAQLIIDGGGTDHEVLGALVGMPPQAIAFIEERQSVLVLAAKINRWWGSLSEAQRPAFVTMRQFHTMFGGTGIGTWQIGDALRYLSWTSSRRSWRENGPRCRIWLPPHGR